jgi:hypothetical protein
MSRYPALRPAAATISVSAFAQGDAELGRLVIHIWNVRISETFNVRQDEFSLATPTATISGCRRCGILPTHRHLGFLLVKPTPDWLQCCGVTTNTLR